MWMYLVIGWDILPPPNQRFGGGFQLFLHVTPSSPLLRERFAEFSVLTSSTGLGPLLLKTESGYGELEGSSHSSDAPCGGEHKFGVAPPYLDERMFYGYKNILPIHPPPNLRFGRELLGNKVKRKVYCLTLLARKVFHVKAEGVYLGHITYL
jgi:hypothetical protein